MKAKKINPKAENEPAKTEVTVTCTSGNVHLGDGRKLLEGQSAVVSVGLAEILKKSKNVKVS